MFSVNLKQGVKFKIENSNYTILKILNDGNAQVQDEKFGDTKIFTRQELINLLSSN